MRQVRNRVVLIVAVKENLELAAQVVDQAAFVESTVVGDGRLVVTLKENENDFSPLAGALVTAGLQLTEFREEETNLESAFMALTKGSGTKI